jgi:hypothetical protein
LIGTSNFLELAVAAAIAFRRFARERLGNFPWLGIVPAALYLRV